MNGCKGAFANLTRDACRVFLLRLSSLPLPSLLSFPRFPRVHSPPKSSNHAPPHLFHNPPVSLSRFPLLWLVVGIPLLCLLPALCSRPVKNAAPSIRLLSNPPPIPSALVNGLRSLDLSFDVHTTDHKDRRKIVRKRKLIWIGSRSKNFFISRAMLCPPHETRY